MARFGRLQVLPAGFRVEDVSRDGRLVLATRPEFRSDAWRLELPGER
ncbi:MAG: hypothetical protein R2909_15765 [Gemmatimonadales bacterium]